MKKIILCLAILFVGKLWAVDPGVSEKEIVIGAHTSESGAMAIYSPFPRAASAYFDRLNEQGGVNGRQIKFIRVDTQGEHLKSVQATKKLVEQDQIFAMVLGHGTSHQAVYKYLADKGVPDLYFTDGLLEYGQPLKKTVVSGNYTNFSEGMLFGELQAKKFPGKKVCFLITDDAMGEEFLKGAKESIEASNKKLPEKDKTKIGKVESVSRTAAQANQQILSLKKESCEVVFNYTYSGLCPNSISYAFSQDFKPSWFVMSYNVNPKFIELLPAGSKDGVISSTLTAVSEDFGVPGWKDYVKLMEKTQIPVSRASAQGYALSEMFAETLKRAGKDVTREKLIQAAESMGGWKCSLCMSAATTSATNHFAFGNGVAVVTKNGKWVTEKK